jgi:acyl-CoA synthetase (NDP forming)
MGDRMGSSSTIDFERIFHPRRVAIVGVSSEGFGFGSLILVSLRSMGFEGEIFPVNPKGGTFAGLTIYKQVEDIPGTIDLAVIAVVARHVPEALEACRSKGAAGAEILSAGFSEAGTQEGIALGEEIRRIAKRGIRVIGPNCFGIYCPRSGLTFLPGPDLSRTSGDVAFFAQSGGMSVDLAHIGKWMGIRFKAMVSFGNGADVRETQLLDYFADDEETRVISLYIEGVEDGTGFFHTLKRVAAQKPVIIMKGGLSESGQRAVMSHTASLGGDRAIWESMLRQSGAIQVRDLNELAHACLAFSLLPIRRYKGITIIGGGGAVGVAACDTAEIYGMELPHFQGEIHDRILQNLPRPGSSAANPIDVANPLVPPQVLRGVLLEAGRDERVDLQIMVPMLYHYKSLAIQMGVASVKEITPYLELAEMIRETSGKTNKPVILVLPNHKRDLESMDIEEMLREARQAFLEQGIPVFDNLKDAFQAIAHISAYSSPQKRA